MSVKLFTKGMIAAAAFVAAGAASATTTVSLGVLPLGTVYLTATGYTTDLGSINAYLPKASYEYTFTVASSTSTDLTLNSFAFASAPTLLDATSAPVTPTSFTNGSYGFSSLVAGAYKLSFATTKGFSGGELVTFSTPPIPAVPEASSLAMSLAGLGVVGLIARRRKTA